MHSSSLKYVDHTYRDFSRYIDDGGQLIKHKKSDANFPAMLHKILSEPGHSHIITWMPHGRAWKILNKDMFLSSVLPHYFVCKKYASFTRQLNGWGFKRLHQLGPDLGCYYHQSFLRCLPKLTCLIRRLPPNLGKATPFPAGEPNLYRISEVYPLALALPPVVSSNTSAMKSATGAVAETSATETRSPDLAQHEPDSYTPLSSNLAGFLSATSAEPSHGHTHKPSIQEFAVASATKPSSAVQTQVHSSGAQYLASPSIQHMPQEYPIGMPAAATTMPYGTSFQMPYNTQQNHQYQHLGHNILSQAFYSDNCDSNNGQYSTQGQPPVYHQHPPTNNDVGQQMTNVSCNNSLGIDSSIGALSLSPVTSRLYYDGIPNYDGTNGHSDQSSKQEKYHTQY